MSLAFIKLGGSILTDKTRPETLNQPVLRLLAEELAAARRALPELRLLVAHGGGSFGHHWASRYATAQGIQGPESWAGVARVCDAMARLSRAIVAELLQVGLPAVSIAPVASGRASGGRLDELATGPIEALLQAGVIPLLHGDVVVDDQQGCSIISTEALFEHLAPRLRPERLVLIGEAAVYTADPHRVPQAHPIPLIDQGNYQQIAGALGESHGVDVTGGMRAKVAAMWQLLERLPGLTIQLIGPRPGLLGAALSGAALPLGTTIRR